MEQLTSFVGAEGCSELEGTAWIREATPEETQAAIEAVCKSKGWDEAKARAALTEDGTGRPYFPMTLTPEAPAEAQRRFRQLQRMVRIFF